MGIIKMYSADGWEADGHEDGWDAPADEWEAPPTPSGSSSKSGKSSKASSAEDDDDTKSKGPSRGNDISKAESDLKFSQCEAINAGVVRRIVIPFAAAAAGGAVLLL